MIQPTQLRALTLTVGAILSVAFASASPVNYTYVNWSSATLSTGTAAGKASGSMTINGNTINVTYKGSLTSSTQVGSGGTNYYIPTSVYTNSQVANAPTNNNIIGLNENPAYMDTLTFSSPLLNPILDIVSLGSPSTKVTYTFNAAPVILSQGSAYWGGCSTCLSVSGDSLTGTEGSGVIELTGSYSSISWSTTGNEFWNGFTVGVQGLGTGSPAPEPATWMMLLGALGLAMPLVRRRNQQP